MRKRFQRRGSARSTETVRTRGLAIRQSHEREEIPKAKIDRAEEKVSVGESYSDIIIGDDKGLRTKTGYTRNEYNE